MSHERPALRLTPFRATQYAPEVDLARVICPPYDVIDSAARERYEARDPHNIVHLTLPRSGVRHGLDDVDATRSNASYDRAAAALRRWQDSGVIVTDDAPALYVYEHRSAGHVAVGLVGGINVDGPILPHENTFPGPVADRAALMRATGAQLEPILLTYDGDGPASDIVDAATAQPPDRETETGAGTRHRIWRVGARDLLEVVAADLAPRTALIVDGHHRFAAYRAVHDGSPSHINDFGLAMLVDSTRHPLVLSGVHRSVAGVPLSDAVTLAQPTFTAVPLDAAADHQEVLAAQRGAAVVLDDGRSRVLLRAGHDDLDDAFPPDRSSAWKRVDAAVLTDVLLEQRWHVSDSDARVGYHHDAASAVDRAERTGGVAVVVRAPALTEVQSLASAGIRMPRKSTSFSPKPWTGLLMRLASDARG